MTVAAPRSTHLRARAARGISLIELLVGIVISMFTVLAVTQVFLQSERQLRPTTSGAAVQLNGILALDAVRRDVQQAGYGLGGGPWVGACTTSNLAEAQTVGLANLVLAPVVITPAGVGEASDALALLSSGRLDAAFQVTLEENRLSGGGDFILPNRLGVQTGDWMLIASQAGSNCDVFQVQGLSATAPWAATPTGSVPAYVRGSLLMNLGAAPIRRGWSVSGDFRLRLTDLARAGAATPTDGDDFYPDVVLLRALYAKDTDGDGAVDRYDQVLPADRAAWAQVIGVRVALVVRNPQWSRDVVTAASPQWNLGSATVTGSADCASDDSSQCLELGLTHVTSDDEWQHYRYQVYESLIPLRNVLWNIG